MLAFNVLEKMSSSFSNRAGFGGRYQMNHLREFVNKDQNGIVITSDARKTSDEIQSDSMPPVVRNFERLQETSKSLSVGFIPLTLRAGADIVTH